MAKFQLCEFRRTVGTAILKKDVKWERGLAKVREFDWDVEFILDAKGMKVKRVYKYRLLSSHAFAVIDTDVFAQPC